MNESTDIDYRYQYNGKELNNDHGLGWYNYSARFYDAVLGRFTSTDPLSATTPRWTPYRYGFNNPLIMIDPTGMTERFYSDQYGTHHAVTSSIQGGYSAYNTDGSQVDNNQVMSDIRGSVGSSGIIVYGEINGKSQGINYRPGDKAPDGANDFMIQIFEGLNYIYSNGGAKKLQDLVNFTQTYVKIFESSKIGGGQFTPVSTEGGTIRFNPYIVDDYGELGQQSAVVGLAHELDHAWKNNSIAEKANLTENFGKLMKFQKSAGNAGGVSSKRLKEEIRAVKGLERMIARSLGQYERQEYIPPTHGRYYTDNILSTKKIK